MGGALRACAPAARPPAPGSPPPAAAAARPSAAHTSHTRHPPPHPALRQIINDRANNRFPTPLDASTQDDVYVGRVRRDISRGDSKGLDLFVCGDQIKKGAALNAVQVAELLL